MANQLQCRMILATADKGVRLRIITVRQPETWVFNLNDRNALPYAENTNELQELLDRDIYREAASDSERKISPKMRKHAEKSYLRIRAALANQEELFSSEGRAKWFERLRGDDPGLTYKTYIKLIRRWFAGGSIAEGMSPLWDHCGSAIAIDVRNVKDISYAAAKKAVLEQAQGIEIFPVREGKHPYDNVERTPRTRFRVDINAIRVFKRFYEWKKEKRGRTLEQARLEMIREVFSYTDAIGSRVALDALRIPSQAQFDHWWKAIYSYEVRRRTHIGDKNVNLTERPILGEEKSTVGFAGAVGGLDATIWNVYIRSRLLPRPVIGPPVVFRIRCKKTAMLFGLSVGLESASWMGAASAIANCLEDKVAFCRKYRIEISDEDWPIRGLPGEIEADRGETDNYGPEIFTKETSVEVTNTPAGRPDIRPGSESDFRTLQVRMNGMTPGALVEKWSEKSKDDWKIETVYDIEQFTELLLRYELQKMITPRPDVRLTEAMIADGVDGSPLSMWKWSCRNEGGGLHQFDLRKVQRALLVRKPGSIRADGVYFRGILYTAPELIRNSAFMKARKNGVTKCTIAFDPRLVDEVLLVDSANPHQYTNCSINLNIEAQRDYVGKSFSEVHKLLAVKAEKFKSAKLELHQKAFEHHVEITKLRDEAAKQTAEAVSSGESRAAQKSNMSENRKREKNIHSAANAFTSKVTFLHDAAASNLTTEGGSNSLPSNPIEDTEFLELLNQIQPPQESGSQS